MDRGQIKKVIYRSVIFVFILIIILYSGFEIKRYITGPEIILEKNLKYYSIKESPINIKGRAVNISDIRINDYKIFMNEEGYFSEEILLSEGLNEIKISGIDKFGRETKEIIDVFYKKD